MHKLIFRKIFILSHLTFAVADSDVFGIIVFFNFTITIRYIAILYYETVRQFLHNQKITRCEKRFIAFDLPYLSYRNYL